MIMPLDRLLKTSQSREGKFDSGVADSVRLTQKRNERNYNRCNNTVPFKKDVGYCFHVCDNVRPNKYDVGWTAFQTCSKAWWVNCTSQLYGVVRNSRDLVRASN